MPIPFSAFLAETIQRQNYVFDGVAAAIHKHCTDPAVKAVARDLADFFADGNPMPFDKKKWLQKCGVE